MDLLGIPQGLIALTGERLWPHLDALAHWGDQLTHVHLIVAHGDDEPGGPVDRLERFIGRHLPHVTVARFGPINDDDPVQTRETIVAAAEPGKQWLVDLSGGTRLMFAGGLLAGKCIDHAKVIYRQADGPWYELGDGPARQLDNMDERALDRFSARGLIDVTWADTERTPSIPKTRIEPEISFAVGRTLAGRNWESQFKRALREIKARTGDKPVAGHLFESFILNLLRQMGVAADDVAREIRLLDGSMHIQEVDVVVNSHGRLHVIDCKMGSTVMTPRGPIEKDVPIGTQIREAFTTKRLLGDGGDQFILLRPTMLVAEEFRSLCEEYGLRVVDRTDLEQTPLPELLAQLIRPPSWASAPREDGP